MNILIISLLTIYLPSTLNAELSWKSFHTAHLCCGSEFIDCCTKSIEYKRPLKCFGDDLKRMTEASNCVQNTLYGKKSFEVSQLVDVPCCRMFQTNRYDVDNNCFNICKTVITSPSVSPEQRISLLRECKLENPIFQCYETCTSQLRSTGIIPSMKCSFIHKMKTGFKYLISEIPPKQIQQKYTFEQIL